MRIGLFSDTYAPEINGVVSSIVILQNELERHGHEVFVITTNNSLFETEREGNVMRLPGLEIKKLYGYVLTSPIHFSASAEVEAMNLDLIHAHTEFGVGIFARLVARKYNIPLVSTYHTTYEDYTHYVNPIKSKSVDRLAKKAVARLSRMYGSSCVGMIAPSEKTKEMLLKYGVTTPVRVIPTGIDLMRFDKSNTASEVRTKIREEYGISQDDFLVTFVGRIAQEKSIDIQIRAFEYIKKHQINSKLLIVGSGPQLSELQDLTMQLGISDYVKFAGKKPSDQIATYYHASDAFVSASLTETQGLTYIEALASGLPLFARPDDVLENLVVEGKTGYYFDDSKMFSEKLMKHIQLSKDKRKDMVENAQNQVMRYSSEIFYQRVLDLYEESIECYLNEYEVIQVKNKNDYVEIKVEKNDEVIKVMVDYLSYIRNNIRLGTRVTKIQLNELIEQEKRVKGYELCIKKLANKDHTRKEMYDLLTKDTDLEIGDVNDIVSLLEEKGYVDDVKFTHNMIANLRGLLQGEFKINRTLKKRGIPVYMIDDALEQMKNDEFELENAVKLAQKTKNSNQGLALRKKKQKIVQKLFNQGYSSDIIEQAIGRINFIDEEDNELDALRTIAEKAKKRYSSKYASVQLRNMVFRYCSAQGFDIEDIYVVLSEMEWDYE